MSDFSQATLKEDVAALNLARQSRGKAIRAKCLDCCAGSPGEVARCHLTDCPLWPFRFGKDPFSERTASQAAIDALARHRAGA